MRIIFKRLTTKTWKTIITTKRKILVSSKFNAQKSPQWSSPIKWDTIKMKILSLDTKCLMETRKDLTRSGRISMKRCFLPQWENLSNLNYSKIFAVNILSRELKKSLLLHRIKLQRKNKKCKRVDLTLLPWLFLKEDDSVSINRPLASQTLHHPTYQVTHSLTLCRISKIKIKNWGWVLLQDANLRKVR